MVEIKGVTLPVLSISVKDGSDLEALKNHLRERVKGKLFKGSYFIIENASDLPEELVSEIESLLKSMDIENISRMSPAKESKTQNCERLLVVDKSLRSGQKVEHGGDVLVLGDVNKDAEVVAVGNIIVMGTLRGIAIAGALGDEGAVVVAERMEPQQIRIGKKIAISEESERVSPGYPEVARVEDGMIVLEKV